MAGNRVSSDPQERMEWQVDQIRQCLYVLVAIVVLGLAVGGTAVVIEVLAA